MEADFGWANAKSTLFGSPWPSPIIEAGGFVTGGSVNDSYLVKTPWDGSARLRAGWLVTPSTLLYLTGGVAWMHVETASNCSTVPTVNVGNCAPGAFQAGTLCQPSSIKPLRGWARPSAAASKYPFGRIGCFVFSTASPIMAPSALRIIEVAFRAVLHRRLLQRT